MNTLKEFKLHHATVSAEALSVNLPNRNLLVNFNSMIGKFTDFMTEKLPELDSKTLKAAKINLDTKQVKAAVDVPYKSLKLRMVSTPNLLSSDYLTYSKSLLDIQKKIESIYEDALLPFGKALAGILSRPDDFSSITSSLKIKAPDTDQLTKDYEKHFQGKTNKQLYWTVVKRQNDLYAIVKNCSDLQLSIAKQPTDMIAKKVVELSDMLYRVRDKINEPNSNLRPSTKVIKDLSDITYTLAELVSFYSNTNHSANELSTYVEEMIADLAV